MSLQALDNRKLLAICLGGHALQGSAPHPACMLDVCFVIPQHVFLRFLACHFVIPNMCFLYSQHVYLLFSACLFAHALHRPQLLLCALVACMKLVTPTGCRNTSGQVCCIAAAACNTVQQLAGWCIQPWLALHCYYYCYYCIACTAHVHHMCTTLGM